MRVPGGGDHCGGRLRKPGRSWILNLRDSGLVPVVCVRRDASGEQAVENGFDLHGIDRQCQRSRRERCRVRHAYRTAGDATAEPPVFHEVSKVLLWTTTTF